MCYNLEGKISAQGHPKSYWHENEIWHSLSNSLCKCESCGTFMIVPKFGVITLDFKKQMTCYHYINEDHYIYETRSGTSIVYCSDKCRKKHNHRFVKT